MTSARIVGMVVVMAFLFPWSRPADASAARKSDDLELVQSIPRETDLAQADLRFAKDVWVEMADQAKKTIDLGEFYASAKSGEALDPVIEALERAGNRGVKIRFLICNELLSDSPETFERIKKIKGIETRIFDLSKLTGGILHAKYWVVDGKEVYVGSQNFDWRSLTEIHELGMRVPSAALAKRFEAVFAIDWEFAKTGQVPKHLPKIDGKPVDGVEMVASPAFMNPRGIRPAEEALVALIKTAKESLEVQLLNYTPEEGHAFWPVIDNALRDAATRGVKIRMILSNWNLKAPKGYHAQSLAVLPNVDIKIAEIPVSSRGFEPFSRVVHSKYMVVDGKTLWLGTSNWSEDYFRNSRNLELIAERPDLAKKTDAIFTRLWDSKYVKDVLSYKVEEWSNFTPAKPN